MTRNHCNTHTTHIRCFEEITLQSLELVLLALPKIDILIIGMGKVFDRRLDDSILDHFRKKGIAVSTCTLQLTVCAIHITQCSSA
jgi:uncharacterized protein